MTASDTVNWASLSARQTKDFLSGTPIPLVEKAVKELDFSRGGFCIDCMFLNLKKTNYIKIDGLLIVQNNLKNCFELSFKLDHDVLFKENFSQVFVEV